MKLPNMRRPCADCPFRTDSPPGWLGRERMTEITDGDSFVCHKHKTGNDRRQCAGHMLIKGDDNAFVKLAAQMRLDTGLGGRELVFDTIEECIEHHAR